MLSQGSSRSRCIHWKRQNIRWDAPSLQSKSLEDVLPLRKLALTILCPGWRFVRFARNNTLCCFGSSTVFLVVHRLLLIDLLQAQLMHLLYLIIDSCDSELSFELGEKNTQERSDSHQMIQQSSSVNNEYFLEDGWWGWCRVWPEWDPPSQGDRWRKRTGHRWLKQTNQHVARRGGRLLY